MTANVLIVAPAWVGDMVMAHSLVRWLVECSDSRVELLAPPATASLGARMPGVARTHVLDVAHGELGFAKRRAWGRSHKDTFDQAVVLPNSFKSALAPWFARIPRRTGWRGEWRVGLLNDLRVLDRETYPRMVDRFVALAADARAPEPRLTADADNAYALVERLGLDTAGGVTVLCPGAEFGPAKRWPARHFAQVATHVAKAGSAVWLMGSAADGVAAAEIAQHTLAPVVDLCGRTSLTEAVDLLSLADSVVCNDSGLMHVASALDRRVVAVFGSTSPDFTPPLSDQASVVRQTLPCSPCFQRECPLGHLQCLEELAPQRVVEAL